MFVDASLRGMMNALERCTYARGLEQEERSQLVIIGSVPERDRTLFVDAAVQFIADDAELATVVLARVRTTAAQAPRRRRARRTISG